jgi:hypothetical protein
MHIAFGDFKGSIFGFEWLCLRRGGSLESTVLLPFKSSSVSKGIEATLIHIPH